MAGVSTVTGKSLTLEQCKAIIALIHPSPLGRGMVDRALFISLLLCGGKARTWTWDEALDQALNLPLAVYGVLRALATVKKLVLEPIKPDRFSKAYWVMGANLSSPIFTSPSSHGKPWTTHEVTRRLKRYARIAGLNASAMNLRMVVNTHHCFRAAYGSMDETAEMLCLSSPPYSPTRDRGQARPQGHEDWKTHLHGIGRRSASRRLLTSS